MSFFINDREFLYTENTRYIDYLEKMPEIAPRKVLALQVNGESLSPLSVPQMDSRARTLTYRDEEGRRIYERTLQFVLLLAIRRVLGEKQRVRIEHSLGQGIYIDLPGSAACEQTAADIDAEMRRIVAEDLPFTRPDGTKRESLQAFEDAGLTDKVRLLNFRNFEPNLLFCAGGMIEYFYGELAPSTGYVPVFAVKCESPGLILLMPDTAAPERTAPRRSLPKLKALFAESNRWNDMQHIASAADLNDRIAGRGFRELVRVCEGYQERLIHRIADEIAGRGSRLILIAGPSSSGKTTFSYRLQTALSVLGVESVRISMDDYYSDRDKLIPDENGQYDLERLDTLDVPLLDAHLAALLRGETVEIPEFDFTIQRRTDHTHPLTLQPGQVIIIEGIHGLNEQLTASVPRSEKYKIYISALTTLNLDDHNRIRTTDARLLRRLVRDHLFRGTPPEQTIAMWPSVRRGEENYIFPYQEEADVMFNSSLPYELAIMKKYAYPMLKAVPPTDPGYSIAHRLSKFLNYIYSTDALDEVPPGSLLREFVGGSCYARKE